MNRRRTNSLSRRAALAAVALTSALAAGACCCPLCNGEVPQPDVARRIPAVPEAAPPDWRPTAVAGLPR